MILFFTDEEIMMAKDQNSDDETEDNEGFHPDSDDEDLYDETDGAEDSDTSAIFAY